MAKLKTIRTFVKDDISFDVIGAPVMTGNKKAGTLRALDANFEVTVPSTFDGLFDYFAEQSEEQKNGMYATWRKGEIENKRTARRSELTTGALPKPIREALQKARLEAQQTNDWSKLILVAETLGISPQDAGVPIEELEEESQIEPEDEMTEQTEPEDEPEDENTIEA